ncbi:hypothetical protein [Lactiplantibacillus plantarum]|uniref:hypothetical protein n=1 Tax=Lactiplantibacillus plantarum TaxID=1590 RepID=UPI0007B55093|nr:hypothetical protein [Lactiplantibacillus plantarum]KZU21331.1 hypothetical protein Nizo2484_1504 [Lactiplantibacillus plantarum]KZU27726.1 hypothetical protein Nizo2485_1128 [Lactiplantibacillus plantarum]
MEKRIDHEKLNNLVCEVEDRHENGILGANEKEMAPIWKITKATMKSDYLAVSLRQYNLIEAYAAKSSHTTEEKNQTLKQLHKKYSWLNRRVTEYRHGNLIIRS